MGKFIGHISFVFVIATLTVSNCQLTCNNNVVTGYTSTTTTYTFQTPTPQTVVFTDCRSDFDTQMYLTSIDYTEQYSSNGCDSDDCIDNLYTCNITNRETFSFDNLNTGTYNLYIQPYSDGGNYKIEIFCHNSTIPTTSPHQLTCINNMISGYTSETVTYSFYNSKTQTVVFTDCRSDFDTQMYLNSIDYTSTYSTNGCGSDDCEDDRYNCGVSNRETFSFGALGSGTYDLYLLPYDAGGNYEIQIFCQGNDNIDSVNNTENINLYGKFGDSILSTFCGSTIANKFYNTSHPMLLTEHTIAIVVTQNMMEYTVFTLISILFHVLFRLYIESISHCCSNCTCNCGSNLKSKCCNMIERCKQMRKRNLKTNSSIKLRVNQKIKNKQCKKIHIKQWNNEHVLEWIKAFNIPENIKVPLMDLIKNCNCTGEDIIMLESSEEVGESFNITNNEELCNQIYNDIIRLKSEKLAKSDTIDEVEEKQQKQQDNDDKFSINMYSQGKDFTLNQKVTKDTKVEDLKKIYKEQSGVNAELEDIKLYARARSLRPYNRLESIGVVDDKNLISVKFFADGGGGNKRKKIPLQAKQRVNNQIQNPIPTSPTCCRNNCPSSCANCYEKTNRNRVVILKRICTFSCFILCVIVMIHFINEMSIYYKFVGETVKFSEYEISADVITSLNDCIEKGVGKVACPYLFEEYDDTYGDEGYTLNNAETVCSWIYWMLIIANPTIFQYSLLTSFFALDTFLYLLIMFIVAFVPSILCNCSAWITCWFGCCCTPSKCCPLPKCCCCGNSVDWCCQKGVCWYWSCGLFGFIFWIIQLALAFVLMGILLFGYSLSLLVMMFILSVVGLIIVYILACPLCIAYRKYGFVCCMIFETFIGNGRQVDLRTKDIHHVDGSKCNKIERLLKDQFHGSIVKDPRSARFCSIISFIFVPLIIMMLIGFVQTFISTFLVYFVIDAPIYGAWNWFKPFWEGVIEFVLSFGETLVDPVTLPHYLEYIASSGMSWYGLFSFNASFDELKYSLLFIRTILHIFIAVIEVLTNPYTRVGSSGTQNQSYDMDYYAMIDEI
eukprot:20973_1